MNARPVKAQRRQRPCSGSAAPIAPLIVSVGLGATLAVASYAQAAAAEPDADSAASAVSEARLEPEARIETQLDTTAPPSAQGAVEARLDRQRVAAGEPVTLILSRAGPGPIRVDLSPLEADFRVLDRATVSDLREINGRREERQTLRVRLLPNRSGELSVPPLMADGRETQPLALEVDAAQATDAPRSSAAATIEAPLVPPAQALPAAEQISVEASTDLSESLVGQQIVLSVLVTGDGPLPPGRLVPPSIANTDLLILGEERRIAVSGDADGETDQRWIYERRYALFPRSAGRLEIPPSVYSAWRPGASQPEQLRSAALTVEVRPAQPLPADAAPDSPWLPAQQLSLTEAGANAVRLAPGQVIERMLTIRAVGLRAEDLSPIRAPIPFQLQVREDAPRLWNERGPDGVTGYRTERITVSSAEPGLYRLPPATIDWWNVDSGRWERASTAEWQLQVAELDSSSRRPAPDWRRDGSSGSPMDEDSPAETLPAARQPWLIAHWPWLAGALVLALLTGLLWRQRTQRRAQLATPQPPQGPRPAQHVMRLHTAEQTDPATAAADGASGSANSALQQVLSDIADAYRTASAERAKTALLAWAAIQWPERTPSNLSQLSLRLPEPLASDIQLLDKAFYSPRPIDWSSPPVAERLKAVAPEANW